MPSLSVLFLVCSCNAAHFRQNREPPRFAGLLNVKELAARAGYNATDVEVLTEDGYSLWLHRVGNNAGPPVLLQHGSFVAADSWITRGPKRDLAFILLEEGFDVWLSNLRGTAFNEFSTKYKRSDPKFWEFSFDESGYYDIPAFIDTILKARGVNQLYYIGHSLGTTVFFVMTSSRPEYNSKIKAAALMSPTVFGPPHHEMKPFLRWIIRSRRFIYRTFEELGFYQFGSRTNLSIEILTALCTCGSAWRSFCLDLTGLFTGEHRSNIREDEWDFIVPYFNAGTSVNTIYHFSQMYEQGEFQLFDYGLEKNLVKYKSPKPPHYRLSAVTAPIALFWGRNDPTISESSVRRLESWMSNLIFSKAAPDPKFSHMDMILGDNAPRILYPDIVAVLKSFSN